MLQTNVAKSLMYTEVNVHETLRIVQLIEYCVYLEARREFLTLLVRKKNKRIFEDISREYCKYVICDPAVR